ncbi:DUF4350 domain-containing protein [Neobacillus sp. WH10]|uniref:DUF4350 domain-containing protein n=1 Tax=Neobacillus sp. WH10 TaxID=3047873 RepID=UPI0024C1DC6A|nr:DUF4350 domain-containing protein [Neobacillus sp. WH10]WHY75331.1 DUF4350 domain-containing protein [Neobacillus sp. WH10]
MNSQSKVRTWIWLIVLLILFLTISYFSFSPKPQVYPSYVTDSPSPTGVKAFYTYLKKEKEAKSWNHAPEMLPNGKGNQLLVMVEPSFYPEKDVMEDYVNFMKDGNTILLLQTNPKGMFDVNTEFTEQKASPNDKKEDVFDQSDATYRAEISSPIRLQTMKEDVVLLSDHKEAIALKRTYGKGHLIVAIAPEWMTNENLLKNDHLPLLLYLLNEGKAQTFLFDEYIHGGENASTIWNVYPMWFLLLVLQGILIMVLWLWFKGKRFGPIFFPREESVRFSDEGIQAIAAWYLRGKRYHDSLLIQADYVKLLLQERWQIPYSREWQDLSSYIEKKWIQMPARDINSFLNGLVTILEKEKISKQEYLLWSRKLEQIRKEVGE